MNGARHVSVIARYISVKNEKFAGDAHGYEIESAD